MTIGVLLIAAAFTLQQETFSRYWEQITGRRPAAGCVEFAIDAKVSKTGNDAYWVKSTEKGVRIVGSNERSVWYGLYDLLERRGGCRWFWDGDRVPRQEKIDLSGLDVREESRYEYRGIREFAHRGLKRFQAEHWGPDDWKREIDWMLKRRLNCFMPRIGMDDTWQRAYPDVVPYPDPSKPLPGAGKGFDNRSCLWSLEYRGELRRIFTRYALERGLIVPTDYGTMTHWYARTPVQFLEKEKPDFFPVAAGCNYAETDGLVWDIFKKDWLEKYWHLTEAFCDAGYGTLDYLHTIGLGERRIYEDRARNHKLKLDVLKAINARALKANPKARLLLAGWDMYAFWNPEEVKDLVGRIDPSNTVLWDYAGDSFKGRDMFQPGLSNDFTQWGVVGKFPYTFGFLFAYESALDVRGNYAQISDRVKIAAEDPFCRGWILWPETSHSDTLFLEYFTENAWRPDAPIDELLPRFCRRRYGALAAQMEPLWRRVLPIARLLGWRGNYGLDLTQWNDWGLVAGESVGPLADARSLLADIAKVGGGDEFVRRDVTDLQRTILDRLIIHERHELVRVFDDWRTGKADAGPVRALVESWRGDVAAMTRVLGSHPDFSLRRTLEEMKRVAPVPNPDAWQILLDNSDDAYCRSHQYEIASGWYGPVVEAVSSEILRRLDAGDRSPFAASEVKPIVTRCYRRFRAGRPPDITSESRAWTVR